MPLETFKESAIECSTFTFGPVNIRVQTPLIPIELGEKQRVYNSTVVNIQHRSEEASSPDVSVAYTPPIPAPATSLIRPSRAESSRHSLGENKPPVEMVSR